MLTHTSIGSSVNKTLGNRNKKPVTASATCAIIARISAGTRRARDAFRPCAGRLPYVVGVTGFGQVVEWSCCPASCDLRMRRVDLPEDGDRTGTQLQKDAPPPRGE